MTNMFTLHFMAYGGDELAWIESTAIPQRNSIINLDDSRFKITEIEWYIDSLNREAPIDVDVFLEPL